MSATRVVWVLFSCLWAGISLYDWRYRKIPNRAVLWSLVPALAAAALGWASPGPGRWLLPVFGLAAAPLLWIMRVWPAGDAKLFALLSVYLPLLLPPEVPVFKLAVIWLANIFVPAAATLVVSGLWQALRRRRAQDLPGALRRYVAARAFKRPRDAAAWLFTAQFLLLSCVLAQIFFERTQERFGPAALWASSLALFVLSGPLMRFLRRAATGWRAMLPGLALAAWLAWDGGALHWPILLAIAPRAFLINFGSQAFFDLLDQFELETVAVCDLTPRMVLEEQLAAQVAAATRGDDLGGFYRDGMSVEQVSAVKRWCRRQKVREVKIYRCYPFAFWLFCGTMLTALIETDVITFALRLWSAR